jgi:hypothetical protein
MDYEAPHYAVFYSNRKGKFMSDTLGRQKKKKKIVTYIMELKTYATPWSKLLFS